VRAVSVAVQRNRRRQLREETRQQILEAAQAFLRERSFRELSVDAVMSRTGHTRTVFYRHFDDIPSLVLTLIAEIGAELVEVGREWADTDQVGHDVARERLALFVDFYVRNGPLVSAVAEAAHHDDEVERAYSQMVEGFIALTTQAIETRIATGELEPLDAPEIARALVRMLNGYLNDSLGHEPFTDRERVLETVWTIWTRTLFPGR
jgi:TetR/AcrR family transcriptional regulator, ethionamide resistance regulator